VYLKQILAAMRKTANINNINFTTFEPTLFSMCFEQWNSYDWLLYW